MIRTLTGDNDYLRQEVLDKLVSEFVAGHGELAVERLDGEESELSRIQEALTSLPFLAAKKLVVFKNPSASKEFVEQFETLLKGLPETTDLVLVEPKLDKRTALYKFLKKSSEYSEFSQLDASALARWLAGAASEKGGSLSFADAKYLVERVGENQQKLASELEKLILYSLKINRENIEELVEPSPQSRIFDLLDAAFTGRAERTLELYDEQRAQKVEIQRIIAMLAWQLHILAIVKTAGEKNPRTIAAEAKISPFVAEKSARLARNIELARLKSYVNELLELDKQLKTSSIDADEALKTYLLEVGA